MKDNNGKIYYVCFYADTEVEDKIIVYPSVLSKIDYVTSRIKKTGKEVVIVSIAPSLSGKFDGYCKKIDDAESHIYLKSKTGNNSVINKLYFIFNTLHIVFFLLKNVKKEDSVVVYHSLYNRIWLKIYKILSSKDVILQIEDVFSELSPKTSKFRKTEWNSFKKMKRIICVNDILYEKLKNVPKKMISYGSYELPTEFVKPQNKKIRLIYAGVIENVRNAAFLAVKTMEHLPDNYELHVLGFGKDTDIGALKEMIVKINSQKGMECVKYHGRMQGEEYFKFLQSCDIALSTHMYDESSMASADYTFPSKVIVYLANNLRVVAQRLEVLEKCEVSDCIWFYDSPTPENVAKVIEDIDLQGDFNGRNKIRDMDLNFIEDINQLLSF